MTTIITDSILHDPTNCPACQILGGFRKKKEGAQEEGNKDKSEPVASTLDGIAQREYEERMERHNERANISRALYMAEEAMADMPRRTGGIAGFLLGKDSIGDDTDGNNALARYLQRIVDAELLYAAAPGVKVYVDASNVVLESPRFQVVCSMEGKFRRLIEAIRSGLYPELLG